MTPTQRHILEDQQRRVLTIARRRAGGDVVAYADLKLLWAAAGRSRTDEAVLVIFDDYQNRRGFFAPIAECDDAADESVRGPESTEAGGGPSAVSTTMRREIPPEVWPLVGRLAAACHGAHQRSVPCGLRLDAGHIDLWSDEQGAHDIVRIQLADPHAAAAFTRHIERIEGLTA